MELPKYIEKALKDRTAGIVKARIAGEIIDKYAKKLGCLEEGMNNGEGSFSSDITIYCETDCAENATRQFLLKKLQEKKQK